MVKSAFVLRDGFGAGVFVIRKEFLNSGLDKRFIGARSILKFLDSQTRLLRFDGSSGILSVLLSGVYAGIGARPSTASLGISVPKVESSVLAGFAPSNPLVAPSAIGILKSSVNASHWTPPFPNP